MNRHLMFSGAEFSLCRQYRYRLWRSWDGTLPTVAVIGLNPSTADESKDDPTIRRCIDYARRWGGGRLEMLNLFAIRATDPRVMRAHAAPVGANNDATIRTIAGTATLVVAAWGAHGSHLRRDADVCALLNEAGIALHALRLTKGGHPCHPLRLPAHLEPSPWMLVGLAEGKTP